MRSRLPLAVLAQLLVAARGCVVVSDSYTDRDDATCAAGVADDGDAAAPAPEVALVAPSVQAAPSQNPPGEVASAASPPPLAPAAPAPNSRARLPPLLTPPLPQPPKPHARHNPAAGTVAFQPPTACP